MTDGSKTRKLLVGVEVQSLYVIERCSKMEHNSKCDQGYAVVCPFHYPEAHLSWEPILSLHPKLKIFPAQGN